MHISDSSVSVIESPHFDGFPVPRNAHFFPFIRYSFQFWLTHPVFFGQFWRNFPPRLLAMVGWSRSLGWATCFHSKVLVSSLLTADVLRLLELLSFSLPVGSPLSSLLSFAVTLSRVPRCLSAAVEDPLEDVNVCLALKRPCAIFYLSAQIVVNILNQIPMQKSGKK